MSVGATRHLAHGSSRHLWTQCTNRYRRSTLWISFWRWIVEWQRSSSPREGTSRCPLQSPCSPGNCTSDQGSMNVVLLKKNPISTCRSGCKEVRERLGGLINVWIYGSIDWWRGRREWGSSMVSRGVAWYSLLVNAQTLPENPQICVHEGIEGIIL